MKEHKKYTSIVRLGHKSTQGVLSIGDKITITEKIDGANASFILNESDEYGVTCFSRNQTLSVTSGLSGYWDWIIKNISPIKEKLIPNYRYYGEWLVSHKIRYQQDKYKIFYLFSIFNELTQEYLSDEIVKSEAIKLNLKTPEYFYEGEYISFEHLLSFIGKSNITEVLNTGEGIVVKNVNYKDKFGNQIFVKLVSEAFAEVQSQKLPTDTNRLDEQTSLVASVLTVSRVEKMLFKKIDDGELDSNFGIEDMGKILKLISSDLFKDIMKEELELFENYDLSDIRKIVGKLVPTIVKEILKAK